MRKYFFRLAQVVGVTAIAVYCLSGVTACHAAVKLIGGFEGTMASGYPDVPDNTGTVTPDADTDPDPADWFAGASISVAPQFVSSTDPNYGGGVTQGNQALLWTFPQDWAFPNTQPFLRLHGHVPLLNDTADYPYLLMDITTFGHPETVEDDYPLYRQVFTIFNGSLIGFYDRTNGDIDVQQDVPGLGELDPPPGPEVPGLALGSDVYRTWTLVVDMTGPPVSFPPPNNDTSGDGKTSMQYLANQVRIDNNDGTPIPDFAWQLLFAFQGDDEGDNPDGGNELEVVIDNIRFCTENSAAACQISSALLGDYNENNVIDAADYTMWRDTLTAGGTVLANDPTPGVVDESDFVYWRDHFGEILGSGAGAGGAAANAAVPEPASFMIALSALVGLVALRRSSL